MDEKKRALYDRSQLRYPSDLPDEEWALIEPLISPAMRGGGKRPGLCRGGPDQFDDGKAIRQRAATPVLGDVPGGTAAELPLPIPKAGFCYREITLGG